MLPGAAKSHALFGLANHCRELPWDLQALPGATRNCSELPLLASELPRAAKRCY